MIWTLAIFYLHRGMPDAVALEQPALDRLHRRSSVSAGLHLQVQRRDRSLARQQPRVHVMYAGDPWHLAHQIGFQLFFDET
ncbi:MAG: hypothetical protein ACRD3R_08260, partial [Terriglobales bacterium]